MTLSAQDILDVITQDFPGLIDGATEVNGADLVEALTGLLAQRG